MDDMINSIVVPYYNDLGFGWTEDGEPAVRYNTATLFAHEKVPRHRMLSAAHAAASILSRTDVPYMDNYSFNDLVHAYAAGYHDACDGLEPKPERMIGK